MKTGHTFLEKCLHAFELLGRLQQEELDFVFKGGTSLQLRIADPHRLSVGIDIVLRDPRLERVLDSCVGPPFTRLEEDKRRHNRPPRRRHWNFHYNSINPEGSPEPYVILDVLEEDVLYPDVETIPIAGSFLGVFAMPPLQPAKPPFLPRSSATMPPTTHSTSFATMTANWQNSRARSSHAFPS